MNPPPVLPAQLDGAVPLSRYLDDIEQALLPYDFEPANTLAAVSICRDELTQHVMSDVTGRWGATFALGGLGGIPALGRTGWGACLAHVPERSGRGRLLVIGAPHVGVTPDGELGQNLRRGQDHPTPTCGALSSILASWGQHPPSGPDDSGLADGEAQLLRHLVESELDQKPVGVIELTRAAASAVEREMTAQLDALAPWRTMDVAVFIGIQVHLPDSEDHVVPLVGQFRGPDGSTEAIV